MIIMMSFKRMVSTLIFKKVFFLLLKFYSLYVVRDEPCHWYFRYLYVIKHTVNVCYNIWFPSDCSWHGKNVFLINFMDVFSIGNVKYIIKKKTLLKLTKNWFLELLWRGFIYICLSLWLKYNFNLPRIAKIK